MLLLSFESGGIDTSLLFVSTLVVHRYQRVHERVRVCEMYMHAQDVFSFRRRPSRSRGPCLPPFPSKHTTYHCHTPPPLAMGFPTPDTRGTRLVTRRPAMDRRCPSWRPTPSEEDGHRLIVAGRCVASLVSLDIGCWQVHS